MPIPFKPLPPVEVLRGHYLYDPNTGLLSLKNSSPGHPVGLIVGSFSQDGYLTTRFKRKSYHVSRIAWKWMTGEDPGGQQVDHINGDPSDNRWANLRLANRWQNIHNKHRHKSSLSGIPGAQWLPHVCVWAVHVYTRGEYHYFGVFTDPDQVIEILRDYHRSAKGKFFNEEKWLAHIEKSRPWIECCRDMAEHEAARREKRRATSAPPRSTRKVGKRESGGLTDGDSRREFHLRRKQAARERIEKDFEGVVASVSRKCGSDIGIPISTSPALFDVHQ